MKIEKGKRGRKRKARRGLSRYHSSLEQISLVLMPRQLCLMQRLTLSAQGVCRAVSAVECCLKRKNHIILRKRTLDTVRY